MILMTFFTRLKTAWSLFANYYLHYHKVNERNLDWVEFTTKVKFKLRIENEVSASLL